MFLSPFPALRVSAPVSGIKELPERSNINWPAARIVDMRSSGATLSSTLVDVCRRNLEENKRIALVANRLGYASNISCDSCGSVKSCPVCDVPLALLESDKTLTCSSCGHRAADSGRCETCGSGRSRPTGYAIDRLREEVSHALDVPVGKLTAGTREGEDARVIVATARHVAGSKWDVVAVPDADDLLLGSYMEATMQAFRVLYGAAEAARDLILVQTRQPEDPTLRAALQGDYPAFVENELPKLRTMGYPPYGHLAALVFEGFEGFEGKAAAAWRAVESRIRSSLEPGVSMSDTTPPARHGENPSWRVLLRSPGPRSGCPLRDPRRPAGSESPRRKRLESTS